MPNLYGDPGKEVTKDVDDEDSKKFVDAYI
jgi:hypothetical protein